MSNGAGVTGTITTQKAESGAPAATSTQLKTNPQPSPQSVQLIRPGFSNQAGFALLMQMAKVFAGSHIVPTLFRANVNNAIIACHMAGRMGVDPLTVMQNLYIVNGKPGWSSQFLIAVWNSCGKFTPLRFEWIQDGPQKGCRAYATEIATGEKLIGTTITEKMVKAEGWYSKSGSKWQTMPEQMYMYRAAAFMVRAFAPELALGIHTADEMEDVTGGKAVQAVQLENFTAMDDGSAAAAAIAVAEVASVEVAPVEVAEVASVAETQPVQEVQSVQAELITDPKPEVPASSAVTIVGETVCNDTILRMKELRDKLNIPKEKWVAMLQSKFNCESALNLTESEAGKLNKILEENVRRRELNDWATSATQPVTRTEVTQPEAAPFQAS